MKKLSEPYGFSRTELEVFKELIPSSASISDLSRRINKSPPTVMVAVETLQEKGLVDFEKKGNRKIIKTSESKHAHLLQELFLEFPHISWQEVLSYSGIIPLLDRDATDPEKASRTTQWRALRNDMAHGLVTRHDNKITISPRFQKLEEFIQEFRRFNNSRMATIASKAAAIIWSRGSQFIMRVPLGTTISDPRFRPTATTLMPRYGVPLISNVEYYYFSPSAETIGPEEVVLHSLLTDGITNVTLGLILIAKAELDRNRLLI